MVDKDIVTFVYNLYTPCDMSCRLVGCHRKSTNLFLVFKYCTKNQRIL